MNNFLYSAVVSVYLLFVGRQSFEINSFQSFGKSVLSRVFDDSFLLFLFNRVAENESINKMSLHNLATVFGPTLLRPSEKDSKISTSSQPISMNDSWSLEVMAQVRVVTKAISEAVPLEVFALVQLPLMFLHRFKSFSTSFSWRAFQHLTANVKAFSSLPKYNRNMLYLSEEECRLPNELDAAEQPSLAALLSLATRGKHQAY